MFFFLLEISIKALPVAVRQTTLVTFKFERRITLTSTLFEFTRTCSQLEDIGSAKRRKLDVRKTEITKATFSELRGSIT